MKVKKIEIKPIDIPVSGLDFDTPASVILTTTDDRKFKLVSLANEISDPKDTRKADK